MKWASALSTQPSLEAALDEVIATALQSLDASPDLAILFISTTFASEFPRLQPLLRDKLSVQHFIGCGGNGVIGPTQNGDTAEVEEEPGITLTLASLPGVDIQTFHIYEDELPDPDSSPLTWTELLEVDPTHQPHFILFADPTSSKINDLLQGLDYAYPNAVKIGGLTSGRTTWNGSGLFCDDQLYQEGTVGVALSGNIMVETIVAQGCRPIGQPYRVAEAERNVVLQVEEQTVPVEATFNTDQVELQTPLEALQALVQDLDAEERELAQHSLSVGIVCDEFKQDLEPGDFLIRNLIGVDPRIGAIAIGDRIRPGQRIQFHLRDAQASADELEDLLRQYCHKSLTNQPQPMAALLFDCLGRGERFYGEPDFDSQLFGRYLQDIPVSGFFCNGEIGPIAGTTFLHGYTAAFGIFRSQTN
ncbi:FIST N-terminal domain-containing protein [Acaryochloris sp. IP29b_bin.137]|uniref:FIST signal transduction protein n=1 Tax=Acaryochloris sp. IP29b_bin.137 TaxID=2969217 RepID=UPI002607D668|nr:FIST N-terminal domain-containing protein [Acaryochloris sp. IP29b_bin.137]